MINWSDFHFLRPLWLLLLPMAIVLYFLPIRGLSGRSAWAKVIAPHLLPHVLSARNERKGSLFTALFMPVFLALLALAMAGPTVTKLPSDTSFKKAPLIICLEVSEHMLSRDLEPSRLKRAIYKLEDLFKRYQGAEIALVAFAGDAHTVVPLSEDYRTILSLAKTLSPDQMPISGVNIESALRKALAMSARTPYARILIMTSTNVENTDSIAKAILMTKQPVTIWGFASDIGAPLESAHGRFNQHQAGGVEISKLNRPFLEKLAKIDNVTSLLFTPNGSDIEAIAKSMENLASVTAHNQIYYDTWYDLGPYFLAAGMVILLLGFFFARERVWLMSVFLLLSTGEVKALGFSDLFLRRDQQAQLALEQGDAKKAAELFDDDLRKGSAYYRAQMYEKAIEHLSKVTSSEGQYNLGNAYAKKGQLPEAIKAYEQALKADAKNQDAKFNKELLEQLLKDQEKKSEQQNQGKEQDKNKEQKEEQQQPQDQKSDQKQEQDSKPEQKPQSEQESPSKKDSSNQAKGENQENPQDEQKKDEQKSDKAPAEKSEPKPQEKQAAKDNQVPDNKAEAPKKEAKEQMAKPGDGGNLDRETLYYFDQLEQNNSLYLKRKFRYESENNQGAQ